MKRTLLQKVQYLIHERDHERTMREVLQLIKPSAYANNRELMTEAAKRRDNWRRVRDSNYASRNTPL